MQPSSQIILEKIKPLDHYRGLIKLTKEGGVCLEGVGIDGYAMVERIRELVGDDYKITFLPNLREITVNPKK